VHVNKQQTRQFRPKARKNRFAAHQLHESLVNCVRSHKASHHHCLGGSSAVLCCLDYLLHLQQPGTSCSNCPLSGKHSYRKHGFRVKGCFDEQHLASRQPHGGQCWIVQVRQQEAHACLLRKPIGKQGQSACKQPSNPISLVQPQAHVSSVKIGV